MQNFMGRSQRVEPPSFEREGSLNELILILTSLDLIFLPFQNCLKELSSNALYVACASLGISL